MSVISVFLNHLKKQKSLLWVVSIAVQGAAVCTYATDVEIKIII